MFQVFQTFQKYVATVSHGCCKSRSGDVAHVASVSEVFHLFQTYVAIILI
jgi:hypothetical protein